MDCDTVWNVVSAIAAVMAVGFAFETVRETRALRHEDRIDGLLERVADVAEVTRLLADLGSHRDATALARLSRLSVVRAHLGAALDGAGEELPACRRLLEVDPVALYRVADDANDPKQKQAMLDELDAQTSRALDEVAAVLVRLRGQGSLLARLLRQRRRTRARG